MPLEVAGSVVLRVEKLVFELCGGYFIGTPIF